MFRPVKTLEARGNLNVDIGTLAVKQSWRMFYVRECRLSGIHGFSLVQ